ncbi:MAG: multicopper oxidase domain-containing protein [Lysobacter sp.]|nr:multicopper oxidase domain-containing protein [Lysobacter sp.]
MRHRTSFVVVPGSRAVRLRALGLAVAMLGVAPLQAQEAPSAKNRIVSDPVLVPMLRAIPRAVAGRLEQAAEPGEVDANPRLNIRLTEGRIFNPATQRFDKVRLRSYVAEGAPANPITPFVAPTIVSRPGQTVRVSLNNELDPQPNCKPDNINTPHCFNSTNLHSHGLWVSPSGNSDNVLITIRPKVAFEYEYNIPSTHPAGTFWYHPHLHGSTALQVASGMAGALIIRGERPPTPTATGDIDTLLRNDDGSAYRERLVLFQQVAYACRENPDDPKSPIRKNADGTWACGENDIGTIENYDQLGFGTWGPSGRYTSINGQIMPRFTGAQAGRVERWRNIHAGIRDSINLQFVRMRASADPLSLRSVKSHAQWISRNCTGEPLAQFEVASDGLTHAKAIRRSATLLQPGYRSDLLMVFPEAGEYCVIDGNIPASGSVSGEAESRRLLGTVVVGAGEPVSGDAQAWLQSRLVASAERWMPDDVTAGVIAGLRDGLRLGAFVPHATITDRELTPGSGQRVEFSIGGTPTKFMVNGEPYDPAQARDLVLGNVEEWTLTSISGGHPFHIHVNPFEISRVINDATQLDVSLPGSGDPDYAGTKGTWKDTLFVKQGYTLYVRTRYQRYIGEYVLHCHILDHEDQGMMQNVRVLLPDGEGGGVGSGHH